MYLHIILYRYIHVVHPQRHTLNSHSHTHTLTLLKHGIHGLNKPHVIGSKSFRQLRYLGNQIGADVLISGLSQVTNQLLSDDHHIQWVGHLVQQIQCLYTHTHTHTHTHRDNNYIDVHVCILYMYITYYTQFFRSSTTLACVYNRECTCTLGARVYMYICIYMYMYMCTCVPFSWVCRQGHPDSLWQPSDDPGHTLDWPVLV